ncbi:hypothetical protein OH687_04765 [Burkholderia anthina]|nr:hypothetical protein OH687_04765 [Burkholderia anthina]
MSCSVFCFIKREVRTNGGAARRRPDVRRVRVSKGNVTEQ